MNLQKAELRPKNQTLPKVYLMSSLTCLLTSTSTLGGKKAGNRHI